EQLASQALSHRLLGTLARGFTQPAHRQRHPARRTNLDRNLVVGTANTTALDLDHRFHVTHSAREDFERILTGLGRDVLEGTIDDALGHSLLARLHDDVDELGDILVTELRIRQDLALGYFTTTRHDNLSLNFCDRQSGFLRALGTVLRARLLT